ncbi:MAG: hypothetical protein HY690_04305 [Chloroflexi bacterium]|nr:hypothetical protein [Chloroflexota bacterium]
MTSKTVNGVRHVELTADELWSMIDRDARKYLGMDAATFVRLYHEGMLEDTNTANEIAMWVKLGGFGN